VLDKRPCAAVVLSGSSKPARGVIDTELPGLIHHIKTPVFVGGDTAISHQEKLEQGGAICLGKNIAQGLQLINKTLKTRQPR
jgi:hypothetical protein